MNALLEDRFEEAGASHQSAPRDAVQVAAQTACRRIAPLWPLAHFVAVNPFVGLSGRHFLEASQIIAATQGARLIPHRKFYADQLTLGILADSDLDEALREASTGQSCGITVETLKHHLTGVDPDWRQVLPTLAGIASAMFGLPFEDQVDAQLNQWASAYFDQGQAIWPSPWRHLPPYPAWRAHALIDRGPEMAGCHGFRAAIRSIPDSADTLIRNAVNALCLPTDALTMYFHRLLATLGGWAGHARYRDWQRELHGSAAMEDTKNLLAVRLAWDVIAWRLSPEPDRVLARWLEGASRFSEPQPSSHIPSELDIDATLQRAYEIGYQRDLARQLQSSAAARPAMSRPQPGSIQAVFCIDVRSEVFRRALEMASPDVETLGFAGFFGMPIEYVPFGRRDGHARCPVLLAPKFKVHEAPACAAQGDCARMERRFRLRELRATAWQGFKRGAVASFAFVESLGLIYAVRLMIDSFARARSVVPSRSPNVMKPDLSANEPSADGAGIPPGARVELAAGLLRGMSLTQGFGRVVLLVGHGASTANNPYASGLDCGACGGHGGDPNARIAARILNDLDVRAAIARMGIDVPADTWFLAARHDTTTDIVQLYDVEGIPVTHANELNRLQRALDDAGTRARSERAVRLGISALRRTDQQVIARSNDWSQPRPEWGLANCAAFIAAPRELTRGLDLGGRVFLHSYEARLDPDVRVLEQIMTAPMVVASWISLQYYASVVDNEALGSGNKVLHNVVGGLGVFEGARGPLRVGLPWQSVSDGDRLMHEPRRLSVVLAASVEAIDRVIGRQPGVRELIENEWIHLFALPPEQAVVWRRRPDGAWDRFA